MGNDESNETRRAAISTLANSETTANEAITAAQQIILLALEEGRTPPNVRVERHGAGTDHSSVTVQTD